MGNPINIVVALSANSGHTAVFRFVQIRQSKLRMSAKRYMKWRA